MAWLPHHRDPWTARSTACEIIAEVANPPEQASAWQLVTQFLLHEIHSSHLSRRLGNLLASKVRHCMSAQVLTIAKRV